MGSQLPLSLIDFPSFSNTFFYTLSLNNVLCNYPCFVEDHTKHLPDDEHRVVNKLDAFKMKGTLDANLSYKVFFNQSHFKI